MALNSKKKIVIVGAGISGLTLLHYLHQKFQEDEVDLTLLEQAPQPGGTIESVVSGNHIFENGPNGFLKVSQSAKFTASTLKSACPDKHECNKHV